jgi:hypothetical protein
MLNPEARQLLRCTALARAGTRCRAYVVAGLEVCVSHSPWRSRGPGSKRPPIRRGRVACRCEAYMWPHRRGSGVCSWPDPPKDPCPTAAGTRSSSRLKATQQAQITDPIDCQGALRQHSLSFTIQSNQPSFAAPVCREHLATFRPKESLSDGT